MNLTINCRYLFKILFSKHILLLFGTIRSFLYFFLFYQLLCFYQRAEVVQEQDGQPEQAGG
jgi:hypothetical protein